MVGLTEINHTDQRCPLCGIVGWPEGVHTGTTLGAT